MLGHFGLKKRTNLKLGERLVEEGLINAEQLRAALDRQRLVGGMLGDVLSTSGVVTAADLGRYLEEATGFPFIDISEAEIDREIATLLTEQYVHQNRALPVKEHEGHIIVAMTDPLNLAVIDELRAMLPRPITPYLALTSDLDQAIRRVFDVREKTRSIIDEIGVSNLLATDEPEDDLLQQAEEAPIVRLVNGILSGAHSVGASDVHIEPQETDVRVRYRIDGLMYEQMRLPRGHLLACISRLKIMSGLDISERRRPQDGRFSTRDDLGHEYDARLSIMPTVFGEKACLRLLEKSNSIAKVERLGFFPDQRMQFDRFMKRPHGLILVTGPTGSGKSTTLYAALQGINDPTRNINTVEDPVEYKLQGINQMQVNPKIGVTFAAGLRTLVRQDPDVILVGEIRDRETAEISVQAALTGHLVLSTLHTNDAPGAVIRLENMGVEPFLISSSLVGVLGQRLLRMICPHCKETYLPTLAEAEAFGLPLTDGVPPLVARGKGCRRCGGRGTKGRTAAIEIFGMSEPIREAVLRRASQTTLMEMAISEGMVTMRQSAMRKVLEHQIAPEESLRVFAQEE